MWLNKEKIVDGCGDNIFEKDYTLSYKLKL